MRAAPRSQVEIRWPAERFYWAVLDGAALRRGVGRRARTEQLGYLFEAYLPGITIEHVHAAYQRLPGGRYIACGLPRETLEQEVPQDAVSLCPEALPAFIIAPQPVPVPVPVPVPAPLDPARLNLLTGPYRPRQLRRLDTRLRLSFLIIAAACAALMVIGLERRAQALHAEADLVAGEKLTILRDVLGGDPAAAHPLPPEQRLLVERRRLEQTRLSDTDLGPSFDASQSLADVLAVWPSHVTLETESVTVNSAAVTVAARVPTMADAQALADALKAMSGWRLQPFQSQARGQQVELSLRLEPDRLAAGGER